MTERHEYLIKLSELMNDKRNLKNFPLAVSVNNYFFAGHFDDGSCTCTFSSLTSRLSKLWVESAQEELNQLNQEQNGE